MITCLNVLCTLQQHILELKSKGTGVSDGIMEMRFENATTFTKKAISQKILMILTHCKNYVKER